MNEQIAGQENFNLPHDVVMLPSQGRFYKSKKKSVKVGYLTAADENLLSNIGKFSGEQLITRLVRNKLYEPDLNPFEMLEGDVEAVLIFLRNTAFGSEYIFNLVDPQNGNKFECPFCAGKLVNYENSLKGKFPNIASYFDVKKN